MKIIQSVARLAVVLASAMPLLSSCQADKSVPESTPIHTTSPTAAPNDVVIHVAGIVLDADRLPEQVPVSGATITVTNLRGTPVDLALARTQSDDQGRFALRIPMEVAHYPYWWGDAEAKAPGYLSSFLIGHCSPGTRGFVKIGLSRNPPTLTPTPDMQGYCTLSGHVYRADTRAPVAGVWIEVQGRTAGVLGAYTREDGSYSLQFYVFPEVTSLQITALPGENTAFHFGPVIQTIQVDREKETVVENLDFYVQIR